MNGAAGIAHGAGGKAAGQPRLLQCHFNIVDVVQGIEDSNDINAVFHGAADKLPHHIIRIVPIAQQALTAQQHLQLGVGHLLPHQTQPLPRILLQKPQAGVKGRPAPALERVVACLIHCL